MYADGTDTGKHDHVFLGSYDDDDDHHDGDG